MTDHYTWATGASLWCCVVVALVAFAAGMLFEYWDSSRPKRIEKTLNRLHIIKRERRSP